MVLLKRSATLECRQCEHDRGTGTMPATLSSGAGLEDEVAPGWWFHNFEPVWGPFIQWFCGQRNLTLSEFEQAASQVPGLTPIEKTIAISAFRQQQKHGLSPLHTATFRSAHSLSAV